jgi:hypothetical protein
MSHLIPSSRTGKVCALLVLILVGGALTTLMHQRAEAAPYVNPFWANNSPSPESAIKMVSDLAMSPEGVDVRTGEMMWDHFLFKTPGVLADNIFAIRWRSMISGSSQLGNQILPSWEMTAQYIVINQQNPNAPGGHRVDIRHPTGRIDPFMWNGAAYVPPPETPEDEVTGAPGGYTWTDKWDDLVHRRSRQDVHDHPQRE